MSRIWVTGDIHGKAAKRFIQYENKIQDNDVAIICGDFGIPFGINNPFVDDEIRQRQYNEAGWLNRQSWITIAICGNHDDRDAIAKMPKVTISHNGIKGTGRYLSFNNTIFDNIIIIDEPCLWEIHGKTCLMVPGAACHDVDPITGDGIIDPYEFYHDDMKIWEQKLTDIMNQEQKDKNVRTVRLKGWSWWEDEDVNIPALQELIEKNNLYNKHIDYVFSHEAPTRTLFEAQTGFDNLWKDRHLGATNTTQEYLSDLYENLHFDHWFTGHYHEDAMWLDNISTIYYNIVIVNDKKYQKQKKEEPAMNIYPDKPYSQNKGLNLPEDEQKEIIETCQRLYDKMMHATLHVHDDDIKRDTYIKYHRYIDELRNKEIYVEYGWSGHLNEHFIASEEDAWKQEEWLDMLREDY